MRYLSEYIKRDLERKMVFLGGPRQCGKTTLARSLLHAFPNHQGHYYNWDLDADKSTLKASAFPAGNSFIILDEIHKFHRWKSWIKGLFDTFHPNLRFLLTGSARMDIYRRGGDSLLGRYHNWRLHPFSWDEFPAEVPAGNVTQRLLTVGGFPEPFLHGNETEARR